VIRAEQQRLAAQRMQACLQRMGDVLAQIQSGRFTGPRVDTTSLPMLSSALTQVPLW
jgi:hypothetical protein